MDGDGEDYLSALSDDLLRRILHFVPFKEAVSTGVLTRRWGSLWRSSGAVNLAVCLNSYHQSFPEAAHKASTAFVEAASAALDAAEVPITRLTLRVEADDATADRFLRPSVHLRGVVTGLVSHHSARRVEELRVAAVDPSFRHPESEIGRPPAPGAYDLPLPPSETLRVLELTKCRDLTLLAPAAFRRLATLRLSMCSVHTGDLQDLFDAAPELAIVHLESVFFKVGRAFKTPVLQPNYYYASQFSVPLPPPPVMMPPVRPLPQSQFSAIRLPPPPPPQPPPPVLRPQPPPHNYIWPPVYPLPPRPPPPSNNFVRPPPVHPQPHDSQTAPEVRLRCPSATALVLELCGFEGQQMISNRWTMVVDAPRLRSFAYKGVARRFLLRSPAPDLARLDLHLLDDDFSHCIRFRPHLNDEYKDKKRELFWRFVQNFTTVRDLNLKVPYFKDIATIGRARRAELLCAFPNVVRLELDGAHRPGSTTTAVAIANLLHCCPVVRDLRLNLRTVASDSYEHSRYGEPRAPSDHQVSRSRLDYSKSVDRFTRLRSNPATLSKDDGAYEEVPADIPGLSGRPFACLHSSLRRVRLQFQFDGSSSCLGVRLLKFFADNAMVLEEMHVDSGNRRLHEHVNRGVEKWIAPDSSRACLKRKNLTESSWEFSKFPRISEDSPADLVSSTTGFTVVPLQR